jgi:hypothetical protein
MSDNAADLFNGAEASPEERLAGAHAVLDGQPAALDPDLLERLAGRIPADDESPGIAVFRDLLRIESRAPRFRRMLRVWAGKVTTAIRAGDPADAEAWFRGLVEDPTYPGAFADLVEDALDDVSRTEILDELMVVLAAAESGTGSDLVAAWGDRIVHYMIDAMAADEPPVNRKHLVEYLGYAGREDVRLLASLVTDPRWFIARNLAIALGRTGRPQAIPAVESVLDHPDERVRVEAVRSVAALRGDGAVPALLDALTDVSGRVRHAAISLLRASPSPDVIGGLAEVLEYRSLAPSEIPRLVQALAERKDPAAGAALERLAGRRHRARSGRAVRDAARRALETRRP